MQSPRQFGLASGGGFAVVIVLLAGTYLFGMTYLDIVTDTALNNLEAAETRLTMVERLRSQEDVNVSSGRGYLLTGDPYFLGEVRDAEDDLSELTRRLRDDADDESRALFSAVETASEAFRQAQRGLITAYDAHAGAAGLSERFERELLPKRQTLDIALDRYAARIELRVQETYDESERAQQRTRLLVVAIGAFAVLSSIGLASVTSRKLALILQKERTASERAENAVLARNELLGVVAHDLRTPLSAIALRAQTMQRTSDVERLHTGALFIGTAAARMESLIASLLDVSSIEAGTIALAKSTCDVSALLAEVEVLFGELALRQSIVLSTSVAQPGLKLFADRDRVIRVLSNLVGNALKFTKEGGRIDIAAAADGDFVELTVSDTGGGISPAHLPRIFERYWKKDSPTGTGLGLFIARRIVAAHGGQISAHSEVGIGTTFRVTLPRAREEAKVALHLD